MKKIDMFTVIFCLLALLSSCTAAIAGGGNVNVYLLHGMGYAGKWEADFDTHFLSRYVSRHATRFSLFNEYIGYDSNLPAASNETALRHLDYKLKIFPPDIVIGVLPSACDFVYHNRSTLFDRARKIYLIPSSGKLEGIVGETDSCVIKSISPVAIPDTISSMRSVFPAASRIVVIGGLSETDKLLFSLSKASLGEIWPECKVDYWLGDPLEELVDKASKLPPDALILFTSVEIDRNNVIYDSIDLTATISKRSACPIFGFYDTLLGAGIIGGNISSGENYASEAFETCVRLIAGKTVEKINTSKNLSSYKFDWNEMRRWKIDESMLPADSVIINKPDSAWERYKFYIVSGIVFLVFQTALIIVLVITNTRRKRTEQRLNKSLEQIRSIGSNLTSGMIYQIISKNDGKREFTYLSDSVSALYGVTPEEGMKEPSRIYGRIHPEDLPALATAEENSIRSMSLFRHECRVINPDGSVRWSSMVSTPRTLEDGSIRWDGIEFVITDIKRAEEEIKLSLSENETLIRELYHRTKNTLQQISGMLLLQASNHPGNADMKKLVADTNNRIQTIALVHRMLYKSRNLSKISIGDYIRELCELLFKSFNVSRDRIGLEIDIEERFFLIDTAIPFGMVLNELVTNSLKHAFPNERRGTISIRLKKSGPDTCAFVYSDDGIGFPAEKDLGGANTLGMKLIREICTKQMKGSIELNGNKGLECRIEFLDNLYRARV